jgi:hypothetical protein
MIDVYNSAWIGMIKEQSEKNDIQVIFATLGNEECDDSEL